MLHTCLHSATNCALTGGKKIRLGSKLKIADPHQWKNEHNGTDPDPADWIGTSLAITSVSSV